LFTGQRDGSIKQWHIPEDLTTVQSLSNGVITEFKHNGQIQSIKILNNNRLLTKSHHGLVIYWDRENNTPIHKYQVGKNACDPDVDSTQEYFCIGTDNGSIHIYSLKDGSLVKKLTHKRSSKSIKSCAFSRTNLNIVFVGQDSLVWRYLTLT
jgi:WD40 repeat protein